MTSTPAPAHTLAVAVCLGLSTANVIRVHDVGVACAAITAAAAILAETPPTRFACAAIVICFLGWWWGSARLDAIDRSPLTAELDRAGRGVVIITAPPSRGRYGIRARGRVRAFAGTRLSESVQLELPLGRAPPQGAVIEALAVVRRPRPAADGFDEGAWLRRHGIHVVLHVDQWRIVGRRGGLGGVADRIRERLTSSIAPGLAGERRAVLEGIVVGDESELTEDRRSDFRAAGLYHLLAVSGQNVVLVAGGILALAWLAGISRWIGELGALGGIAAYVLAVGAQPSVVRAGIAGALASLAWLLGRLRDAWYALLLGAIALLAWNPYVLLDPGFQLSFAAVAAIFMLAPRIARRLEGYPLPRFVRLAVAVSTACGVATAPIVWLQFGALPLLSVPANALAEPAVPVLLAVAFATAALDPVAPSAAALLAWTNGWLAEYIALCARAIASVPGAQITDGRELAGLLGFVVAGAYAWRRCRTS